MVTKMAMMGMKGMTIINKSMKKYIVFLFAALLSVAGCERADIIDDQVGQPGIETFIATTESSEQTKTTLDPFYNIRWSRGDMISIFQRSTLSSQFRLVDSYSGKTSANFTRVSSSSGGGMFGAGNEFPTNAAVYPYSPDIEVSMGYGGRVRFDGIELPSCQSYYPGSFASGSFPMVAVTQDSYDYQLNFKNLCAVIRLNILGNNDEVIAIKINSNKGECLSGIVSVSAAYGTAPEIVGLSGGSEVTLDCSSYPVMLDSENPTTFDIVVPPVTLVDGFTVTVIDANGGHMSISSSPLTIERNDIVVFPSFTYEDSSEWMFIIEPGQRVYDFMNLENSVGYSEYDNWHDLLEAQYNRFTKTSIAAAFARISEMNLVPYSIYNYCTLPSVSSFTAEIIEHNGFILKDMDNDTFVLGFENGSLTYCSSPDDALWVDCYETSEFKENNDGRDPSHEFCGILLDNGSADISMWWNLPSSNAFSGVVYIDSPDKKCCLELMSYYYYTYNEGDQYPVNREMYYSIGSDVTVENGCSYDLVSECGAFVLPSVGYWSYYIYYNSEGTPSSVVFYYNN